MQIDPNGIALKDSHLACWEIQRAAIGIIKRLCIEMRGVRDLNIAALIISGRAAIGFVTHEQIGGSLNGVAGFRRGDLCAKTRFIGGVCKRKRGIDERYKISRTIDMKWNRGVINRRERNDRMPVRRVAVDKNVAYGIRIIIRGIIRRNSCCDTLNACERSLGNPMHIETGVVRIILIIINIRRVRRPYAAGDRAEHKNRKSEKTVTHSRKWN